MIRLLPLLAFMALFLASVSVVHAQTTTPTISTVAVTSDPGTDYTHALGNTIEVGLTFSEAVTVTGAPSLLIEVGGTNRQASYHSSSGGTQLLFRYTVLAGDDDDDGIAVVANSLTLNGGTIGATDDSTAATLTHAENQANDHLVDGIAPKVTIARDGEGYVDPDSTFTLILTFTEQADNLTTAGLMVTNGAAESVSSISASDGYASSARWEATILPSSEGPVTVKVTADAAADAYGDGNVESESTTVTAANPVSVSIVAVRTGFFEGTSAVFCLTRSRDNGAVPVTLSLDQTGDYLSGMVKIDRASDPANPEEVSFESTPAQIEVTFEVGETQKRLRLPTQNDEIDEPVGSISMEVVEKADQYKYIPGSSPSASANVQDDDVASTVSVFWSVSLQSQSKVQEGERALIYLLRTGLREAYSVYADVTGTGGYLDLDGADALRFEHEGEGRIRVDFTAEETIKFIGIPTRERYCFRSGRDHYSRHCVRHRV